ncbi:hypothetical protein PSY31_23920, partial [Shigella flexneri]|nr:hypothetical protein [Shigella flexneri]
NASIAESAKVQTLVTTIWLFKWNEILKISNENQLVFLGNFGKKKQNYRRNFGKIFYISVFGSDRCF